MMKPSETFRENVAPQWALYETCSNDKGVARATAQTVNNQVEWMFQYYLDTDPTRVHGAENVGEFRTWLAQGWPDILIVNDLADAAKHRFLTRNTEHRIYCSATAAFAVEAGTLVLQGDGREVKEVLGGVVEFLRDLPD